MKKITRRSFLSICGAAAAAAALTACGGAASSTAASSCRRIQHRSFRFFYGCAVRQCRHRRFHLYENVIAP